MDPTQALTDIRSLTGQITQEGVTEAAASELVDKVVGLDEWMTSGGFAPDQWRNVRLGRPREVKDGVKLMGVTHGTRSGYNQGCKCLECRKANREGAARQREARKQKEQQS